MSTTVRPQATDLPGLTRVTVDNLPVSDRFSPPLDEIVKSAGAVVFTLDHAVMPHGADVYVQDELGVPVAVVADADLAPDHFEEAVYKALAVWFDLPAGKYVHANGTRGFCVRVRGDR
ncbi:hypothetical protein [Yinghuangia soli]|uniref:Uncharacterized protein n=1 Tax=Yinghuangia soli TaxID=2908204 RepID=A0AA41U245_9ACTN|nr:hypothetical protein [Yinghuangia soli]MCF2526739.1 hypothetical protein [Yinghuangia soli]